MVNQFGFCEFGGKLVLDLFTLEMGPMSHLTSSFFSSGVADEHGLISSAVITPSGTRMLCVLGAFLCTYIQSLKYGSRFNINP